MRTFVRDPRHSSRQLSDARPNGQALVEFALAVIPFLILLMGVIDLGRGIYMMNGTSEAARDIARVTIVHLTNGSGQVGMSSETSDVISTQEGLVPGLTIDPSTDIECVDAYGVVQNDALGNGNDCTVGVDFIRVHVEAPFTPITPLVSAFGTHTFDSTSRMSIP
jgi:Flp pilus assembly protein TadG